mgnify:CR=1 FL=1
MSGKDTYGTTKRIEVLDGDLEFDAKDDSIKVIGSTNSSSSSTGSLVVSGGVGIAKDLYVDGNIVSGGSFLSSGFSENTVESLVILTSSVIGTCDLNLKSGGGSGCDVNITASADIILNASADIILNASNDITLKFLNFLIFNSLTKYFQSINI